MDPFSKKVRSAVDRRKVAIELLSALRDKNAEAQSDYSDAETAHGVITEVAKSIQKKVHLRISTLVSRCLSAVFEDPYEFDIRFETKAGGTQAELLFKRGDLVVDPLTGAGGGVVDVAAFALRLACLSMQRPSLRRVLVLDEPFRFVSASYRDRVRDLLKNLSDELNIQIIMVTHIEEFRCGNVIEMKGSSDAGLES